MVSTLPPSACNASIVQDFTAMPLRWMTQAPHCEVSQPTCVPVSRRCSRRNCTSSVRGSTSAVTALPFTVIETAGIGIPPQTRAQRPFFTPDLRSGIQIGTKLSVFRLFRVFGTRAT